MQNENMEMERVETPRCASHGGIRANVPRKMLATAPIPIRRKKASLESLPKATVKVTEEKARKEKK